MEKKSSIELLLELKHNVEKIETELVGCKRTIDLLEQLISKELGSIDCPPKTKKSDINYDSKAIVEKIETEFKNNQYDTLSWLVDSKSKITKDVVILILSEGGIILAKGTAKNKISDAVKQILSTRHSFSKS